MNPSVPQSFIDEKLAADPVRAAADYLAQFRSDMEGFVSREALQACVSAGVFERPPESGISYQAFVDPAGGSGSDSMTLCIAHKDFAAGIVVIDALREVKPPFSPAIVVSEFCALLSNYKIHRVVGDKFGGGWPAETFNRNSVSYEAAPKPKANRHVDLLATVNSRRIALLDHARAFNQTLSMERRAAANSREQIDHAPGQHDDLVNVIALACSHLATRSSYDVSMRWVG